MSNPLTERLQQVLEREHIAPLEQVVEYSVDGMTPQAVVFPPNRDALCRVLALASELKMRVIPWGGGTQMALGNPPKGVDIVVGLKGLDRLVAHEPYDLSATVEAGMTLEAVQRKLGERGQFLPLEAPLPSRATIGGILAANTSGPSRLSYGTARDWLIGIRVVHADGVSTKAGGKVVKNVTGYDLNKLYIGSLGTLAIIVEATFKIAPLPQARQTLAGSYTDLVPVVSAASRLLKLSFQPQALVVVDREAAQQLRVQLPLPQSNYVLLTLLSGAPAALKRKVDDAAGAMGNSRQVEELDESQNKELWQAITDLGWSEGSVPYLSIKVSVLPSQVARLLEAVVAQDPSPFRRGLVADVGSGVVRFLWWAEESQAPDLEAAQEVVSGMRETARALGGYAIIEKCPVELKRTLDVWGEAPASVDLMRRIKEQLDPEGILNPGRFVGGI